MHNNEFEINWLINMLKMDLFRYIYIKALHINITKYFYHRDRYQ